MTTATVTITARQQIRFECAVTDYAAEHRLTRYHAIIELLEKGINPETMPND